MNQSISHFGIIALFIFFIAYILVIIEEITELRKSKPMLLAAGLIWFIVIAIANYQGFHPKAIESLHKNLLDFVELLLFIITAMTYVNALQERNVFEALKSFLIRKQFSYKKLFWVTGFLAFFISALADNLTTAIALSAVILSLGKGNARFTNLACINLVVAANAGGAFSPFGDITTLMVWQAGLVPFAKFFHLFLPSFINFFIPALCMHFALPKGSPENARENIKMTAGAKRIILFFLITIALAVLAQSYFKLPPAIGMMLGLSFLQFFAYYTKKNPRIKTLEIFPAIQNLNWDTLLFFYGIIFSLGGLATLGYLEYVSHALYSPWFQFVSLELQQTLGNIAVGIFSAVVDNIPLMFSIITLKPNMDYGQWLLLTLTCGVGGSLLSIGSAAGVAVMGQAHGLYTFFSHLKWFWAIALGYFASIFFHLWWNHILF